MVRRLVGLFDDWRLRRMPVRVIPVTKPLLVRVYLMGDEGETWLAQTEWEVTVKEWDALNRVQSITLGVDIWEDGGTVKSSWAHLLPDTRRDRLPNSHAYLAVAEKPQSCSCPEQSRSTSASPLARQAHNRTFWSVVFSSWRAKSPNRVVRRSLAALWDMDRLEEQAGFASFSWGQAKHWRRGRSKTNAALPERILTTAPGRGLPPASTSVAAGVAGGSRFKTQCFVAPPRGGVPEHGVLGRVQRGGRAFLGVL